METTQVAEKAIELLTRGDWEGLRQAAFRWSEKDAGDPTPKLLSCIASFFTQKAPSLSPLLTINKEILQRKNVVRIHGWLKSLEAQEACRDNLYVQLLSAFLLSGDPSKVQESVAMLERLSVKHPEAAEVMFLLGVSWCGTEKGISYYEKAVTLNPKFPVWFYYLAKTYHDVGWKKEAEEALRRAIALDPDFIDANYQLGSLFFAQGLRDQGEFFFKRVLEIDPESHLAKDAKTALETKEWRFPCLIAKMKSRLPALSRGTIILISLLAIFLIGGPITKMMGLRSPLAAIIIGVVLFFALSALFAEKK